MKKGNIILKRYGPPGHLDTAPHGTICQVENECELDIYVQVSKNDEVPNWMMMGTFPSTISKKMLQQKVDEFKSLKF